MDIHISNDCKYCSNQKNSNESVDHPECIEIYEINKDRINEEFYKPQKIFINYRRSQNKKKSCCGNFFNIMMIIVAILTEIYRIIASVFLVVFAPKDCSMQICTYESLYLDNLYNMVSVSIGLVTFIIFSVVYVIEIIREHYLRSNLIYNEKDMIGIPGIHLIQKEGTDYLERPVKEPKEFTFDFLYFWTKPKLKTSLNIDELIMYKNDVVTKIKSKLAFYNILIQKTSYYIIFIYIINIIFAIIATKYYNNIQQAYVVILTNIILICPKLYNLYMITQDDNFNTNSFYLTKPLEYNDYNDKNKDDIENILIEKRIEFFKDPRNSKEFMLRREAEKKQMKKETLVLAHILKFGIF
jgi:hypothetical protein